MKLEMEMRPAPPEWDRPAAQDPAGDLSVPLSPAADLDGGGGRCHDRAGVRRGGGGQLPAAQPRGCAGQRPLDRCQIRRHHLLRFSGRPEGTEKGEGSTPRHAIEQCLWLNPALFPRRTPGLS